LIGENKYTAECNNNQDAVKCEQDAHYSVFTLGAQD